MAGLARLAVTEQVATAGSSQSHAKPFSLAVAAQKRFKDPEWIEFDGSLATVDLDLEGIADCCRPRGELVRQAVGLAGQW